MTILETLISLRDNIKVWCVNNFSALRQSLNGLQDALNSEKIVASDSATGTSNVASTSGVYLNHVGEDGVKSSNKISGSGATTVTSDKNGNIIISSIDNNTDTKVTSADNHYTPTANDSSAINVDASSTTAATWNSTSLVTGVNLQRDAKGHVTGLTVDSIKMPANPNTDTTYSNATTSAAGLMSATDKKKLDGITDSADAVSVSASLSSGTHIGTITVNGASTKLYAPTAGESVTYDVATSSSLGLIKSGGDITVDSSGIVSVNNNSHDHIIGNIDGLQDALNGYTISISGNIITIKSYNGTTSSANLPIYDGGYSIT